LHRIVLSFFSSLSSAATSVMGERERARPARDFNGLAHHERCWRRKRQTAPLGSKHDARVFEFYESCRCFRPRPARHSHSLVLWEMTVVSARWILTRLGSAAFPSAHTFTLARVSTNRTIFAHLVARITFLVCSINLSDAAGELFRPTPCGLRDERECVCGPQTWSCLTLGSLARAGWFGHIRSPRGRYSTM
jgi:hypothetical protein